MTWIVALVLMALTSPASAGSIPYTIDFEAAIHPAVANSDGACYLARYPDVAADPTFGHDPWRHFITYGVYEGRTWGCGPGQSGIQLMGYPGAPAAHGGINYLNLPVGSQIMALCAEFSVKVGNSEVLWQIRDGSMVILSAHNWGPGDVVKCHALPVPYIVQDGLLWIYAEGWGDPNPAGIETQTQVWVGQP